MDLSTIIREGATVDVLVMIDDEIVGDNGGVILKVRSSVNPETKKFLHKEAMRAIIEAKDSPDKEKELEHAVASSLITAEQAATLIVGWEWNGNSYGELGNDPEFNNENLLKFLKSPLGELQLIRIAEKSRDMQNFMNA